jgi:hypothetical protein
MFFSNFYSKFIVVDTAHIYIFTYKYIDRNERTLGCISTNEPHSPHPDGTQGFSASRYEKYYVRISTLSLGLPGGLFFSAPFKAVSFTGVCEVRGGGGAPDSRPKSTKIN